MKYLDGSERTQRAMKRLRQYAAGCGQISKLARLVRRDPIGDLDVSDQANQP